MDFSGIKHFLIVRGKIRTDLHIRKVHDRITGTEHIDLCSRFILRCNHKPGYTKGKNRTKKPDQHNKDPVVKYPVKEFRKVYCHLVCLI